MDNAQIKNIITEIMLDLQDGATPPKKNIVIMVMVERYGKDLDKKAAEVCYDEILTSVFKTDE